MTFQPFHLFFPLLIGIRPINPYTGMIRLCAVFVNNNSAILINDAELVYAIGLWSAAVYTAAFLAAKPCFAALRREHGSRTPKGGYAAKASFSVLQSNRLTLTKRRCVPDLSMASQRASASRPSSPGVGEGIRPLMAALKHS